MFDLRHLEHSTIIYEDPQHSPLLRLAWNKQDPNYLATVAMDACEVKKSNLDLLLIMLIDSINNLNIIRNNVILNAVQRLLYWMSEFHVHLLLD